MKTSRPATLMYAVFICPKTKRPVSLPAEELHWGVLRNVVQQVYSVVAFDCPDCKELHHVEVHSS